LAETAVAGDFFEDAEHVEGGQLAHGSGSTLIIFLVFFLASSRASPLPQFGMHPPVGAAERRFDLLANAVFDDDQLAVAP
ncbi:hypothetical protein, partial [Klebsiella pneumoniae]|uniref:hypothetical protein n=1 Tax=Klebsiella pneumoniae TaxID=573 RepID=UPI0039C0FA87